MNLRALAGLGLLVAFAGALLVVSRSGEPDPQGPGTTSVGDSASAALDRFTGPDSCLPCHADVVSEWRASMHAQAFLDPQVRAPSQSNNFQKTECLPCHAPAPLFDHGILEGTRVLARGERRADGIDCLSCHRTGEGMAASRTGLTGACRPVYREELSTHRMCAACHDQHNTHEEWLVSPAAGAGDDCISCHMQRVARTDTEVGAPRSGRSHRFLGGRDRDFALAGLALTHELRQPSGDAGDRVLAVTLENRFAGHNLPTDSRNRALDLVVTLFDAHGLALPATVPLVAPGETEGTARRRFRNPYRSSGNPSTQLPAGESSRLEVPLPSSARRARIELLYKLQPFITDGEAHWSLTEDVVLP